MKTLIRFLLISNVSLCVLIVKAENIKPYHQLLDSLISKNQWNAANELAQRMVEFADDSMKKEIYFKQGLILLELDMAYEGYGCFQQVYENKFANKIEKSQATINSALCFVQMEEYSTALHFLEVYPIDEIHKTSKNVIAGYCNYMLKDYESAKSYFYFAGFDNYDFLFNKDLKRLQTLKTFSIISSALLPGSGQIILGKPLNGASALAVNVGLAILVLRATSVSTLDSILFTTPIFTRYYIGNIARTSQFADEKINHLKKKNIKKLLKHY